MTRDKGQKFSEKHGPGATVDSLIKEKIIAQAKGGQLPCAVAQFHHLAKELREIIAGLAHRLRYALASIDRSTDLAHVGSVPCRTALRFALPTSPDVNTGFQRRAQAAAELCQSFQADLWCE